MTRWERGECDSEIMAILCKGRGEDGGVYEIVAGCDSAFLGFGTRGELDVSRRYAPGRRH